MVIKLNRGEARIFQKYLLKLQAKGSPEILSVKYEYIQGMNKLMETQKI
jgi:hypothetical protein